MTATWTVQRLGDRRTYSTWASYCYQGMAEDVARREARDNPGTVYRVVGPGGVVTWAGAFCAYCEEEPATGYVRAYNARICRPCYDDHHSNGRD